MSRIPTILFLSLALSFVPANGASTEDDNAARAGGFVCRTVSDQSLAVVMPFSGIFIPGAVITFHDEQGKVCASGTVKSSYPDLAYVEVDNAATDCLKKGFIATAGPPDNTVKLLCGYSMNFQMVLEKGGSAGHKVPPNVISLRHGKSSTSPVAFHHYEHSMECWKCHHRSIDEPCKSCHPRKADKVDSVAACIREICTACHKEQGERTAKCTWCHKDGPPPAEPAKPPSKQTAR